MWGGSCGSKAFCCGASSTGCTGQLRYGRDPGGPCWLTGTSSLLPAATRAELSWKRRRSCCSRGRPEVSSGLHVMGVMRGASLRHCTHHQSWAHLQLGAGQGI